MIDTERLKIAVFIDFDNIEIGVKTTLHTPFDIAAILDGIKERGEVVTKIAYGDWKRAGDYGRLLSQHAIRMVQRNLTPGGDKNGADINLALDALEMAFTHDHINAFVIVGGDSDFITLVEKLKQYDKKVFVVGGRQFTSQVMQKNCHEFIAYENLVGGRRQTVAEPRRENGAATVAAAPADVSKVVPLVKRALKVLADREVSPQLGLLKSTLLQLDSTFSERDYGVSTFRDFIEKIAKTGIITLRHSGRSMLVDAVDVPTDTMEVQPATVAVALPRDTATSEMPVAIGTPAPPAAPPVRDPEQIQQMTERLKELFAGAAHPPRWPMYVRQIKQYLRSLDASFDERKWGFATIMEFLRECQRVGLFRLERDRRGQVRVFPGPALPAVSQMPTATPLVQPDQIFDAPDQVFDVPDRAFDATEPEPGPEQRDSLSVEAGEPPTDALSEDPGDSIGNVLQMTGEGADAKPVRSRRTRKSPTAGKPAARKPTGAKAGSRRGKPAVPSAR